MHPLKGDLRGLWSVTVRANWRVTFRFENGQAIDVDLVDYHGRSAPMRMKDPPHPGELVADSLDELGWTISDAAKGMGLSRQQLHNVIAGRSAITPGLAVKLERAIGSTADAWLAMQNAHDIARERADGGAGNIERFARK